VEPVIPEERKQAAPIAKKNAKPVLINTMQNNGNNDEVQRKKKE